MNPSYTSRQVKLNHPNKVLSVNVTGIRGLERWPFANGAEDPWYADGNSPRFYRWGINMDVATLKHGSHLTRDPFEYNGLDVQVGDWIAGATDGRCLKIISIISKTKTSVTCIVEDWLRYNTFKSTNGNGMFSTGSAILFTLNENGIPMLDPLPSSALSTSFFSTVHSRFQYLNPQLNYVLEQKNHNFAQGDVVSVTEAGYVKSNTETADRMIGVVIESGPGPNMFMMMPNNRIIDFDPGIPGVRGETIYVNTDGTLSNSQTQTAKVAFLNVQSAIPTVLTGSVLDPEIGDGNTITFNGINVTFTGAGGTSNTIEIVNQINVDSNTHFVTAEVVKATSTAGSDKSNLAYGQVGGFTPFSAYINNGSSNTLITFTSNGAVYAGIATPSEMAADIAAASIANLYVFADTENTMLSIGDNNGNTIVISNDQPDANGFFFVGTAAANISGLPETIPGNSSDLVRLRRDDGGEILINEDSDVFLNSVGIASGHNGSVPLAMNIEQGLRTGGTTVVSDIAARDALLAAVGDQAHVLNKGDGEWGLYLHDGSGWVSIATQDSASTDAKTLTTEFTMPIAGNSSVTVQNLGNISAGRKITTVSVDVIDAVVGGAPVPTIIVGTDVDNDAFFTVNDADLNTPTDYLVLPEYVYPDTETQDMIVRAQLNHNGATSGNIVVKVTYV